MPAAFSNPLCLRAGEGQRHRVASLVSCSLKASRSSPALPVEGADRIPAKYLAEERAIMTESEYMQEFCCTFVDPDAALFRLDVILRAIDPTLERLIL